MKLDISGKELMFLYDTESQFFIITREDYERLSANPPLQQVEKSGLGVDGSKFYIWC